MPPEDNAKICGTVPIRFILILWAVIKTLAALCSILYIAYIILLLSIFFKKFREESDFVLFFGIVVVLEAALLVDIAMSITLIVGESKKSCKLVTAYFRYSIYAVVVAIIITLTYTIYELAIFLGAKDNAPWRKMKIFQEADGVQLATLGTIYVLFEVFIVYLLRMEVTSLRNQQRMAYKSLSERAFFRDT